jgi:uncharacterized protein (TIGR03437 family)
LRRCALLLGALIPLAVAFAQAPAGSGNGLHPDWRHIGNSAVELALASPASGAVDRAWFSPDGARLFVRTATGRVFQTADFEKWQPSAVTPPEALDPVDALLPEGGRAVRSNPLNPQRLYAFGQHVFRSDDGGGSWTNVTAYQHSSIIGGGMRDLAVSPLDSDDVVVANDAGVWRSLDGGLTWAGLNDSLPNLPVRKLAALPQGSRGVRLLADGAGIIEWAPGEKQAWRSVAADPLASDESSTRRALAATLAVDLAGPTAAAERGAVESIWVDPKDARTALAALGGAKGPRVLRTINGGQYWDDLTADLPEGGMHGVVADRATGAVYVATDRGVFFTRADLNAAAPPTNWTPLAGLPEAPALDLRLDSDGNQLFVALEGYGVYAALAPHRLGSLRLVNAADFSQRPAAPGSLLSVLGGRVRTARAGALDFPVLAATDSETQIQVPFAVRGGSLSVALDTGQGSFQVALPVENVSPAVFIDRDGTPLVLNADSGVLLDAMSPVRSNGRLQILATGLGKVRPDWPAGMAGPADEPPKVVAAVHAFLDRSPLEVTRAVLAPGYIGLYLVEVQLPAIVNAGPAELHLESEGRESNRVRVWLEP